MGNTSKPTTFRIIATALVLLISISMFVSCSKQTENQPDKPTDQKPDTTEIGDSEGTKEKDPSDDLLYIEGGEGVTLTYWSTMDDAQTQYFTTMAEHTFYQWFEERTGVKVEFIHTPWEQREQQLTLMISTGNFYDILETPEYPGGPQNAINEKCYVDLQPYLDEYMPNYKKALFDEGNEYNDWEWSEKEKEVFGLKPQPSFAAPMYTAEGQLWGVCQIWRDEIPAEYGPVIRADWLREEGLEIPETIDELEVVLEAFKQRGVFAPMSLNPYGYSTVFEGALLLGAFETGGYFDLGKDGKTIEEHSFIKDEFREYLELVRDWYAKGYIDPDFMNSDDDTLWSMMLNDQLGIWLGTWYLPQDIKMFYQGEQDFELVAMPLPRKSKDQVLRAKLSYLSEPGNTMHLTTSCEHPEIAVQWMDKHFTKEAALRMNYGVEGEHYEMVDGVPLFKPSFFEDEDTVPLHVKESVVLCRRGPAYWSTRASILLKQDGDNTKLGEAMQCMDTWGKNAEATLRIPFTTFQDDDYGVMANYMTEVDTYAQPMIIKFIIGEESIEEKWDEFVKTCIDLGINKAREIWQESYSRMLNNID